MLEIEIDEDIRLEQLNKSHAKDIFNLVNLNRAYLRQWLTFVDSTQDVRDTENYITHIEKSSVSSNSEIIISIIYYNQLVGLVGLKKVDWANRIMEIGYWLDERYQGRGIITRSCLAIIEYAFEQMEVNRIEIKCGVGNKKSINIPRRLGFAFEGIEREGELVNGKFIDIEVYSLLKKEWKNNYIFKSMELENNDSNYNNSFRKKPVFTTHKKLFHS